MIALWLLALSHCLHQETSWSWILIAAVMDAITYHCYGRISFWRGQLTTAKEIHAMIIRAGES